MSSSLANTGRPRPLTRVVRGVAVLAVALPVFRQAAFSEAAPRLAVDLPGLSIIEKPADGLPEKRALAQPPVPAAYKKLPYVAENPRPDFTQEELDRGYLLFRRPITDPIYRQTRPLGEERISYLDGFAARGEFEPLTFSIYPSRQLKNLKVRVSALEGAANTIPRDRIDVRLVTYWNVRYPKYNSKDTYRNVPELLEPVTVHTSPAGECQRYWITVHVPEDAKPGRYRGAVTIMSDGSDKAVSLPILFRVLAFDLRKDPNKHYSAYVYDINLEFDERMGKFTPRAEKGGKEWVERAARNEYRAMADHGFDVFPPLYYRYDPWRKEVYLPNEDFILREVKKAGMGGFALVVSCGVRTMYEQATGKKMGKHCLMPQPPPESIYTELKEVLKKAESRRKAKGWPEFIYAPVDEVHSSSRDFGVKIYRACKEVGVRTYVTKDPNRADAVPYRPYVDFWCSQPFAVSYDEAVSSKRHGYWAYPNHISCEDRVPRIMCKGGRMTYGFGYWRSGYTLIVPWTWRWKFNETFNFLDGYASDVGNEFDEDGNVVPAVYWECFREGVDDLRYIYTLQAAVQERRASKDARCAALIKEAEGFLQSTWDRIPVLQKYRYEGLWPSSQFQSLRWQAARLIESLSQFPALKEVHTPSVLVGDTSPKTDRGPGRAVSLRELPADQLETAIVWDEEFAGWKGSTEVTVTTSDRVAHQGRKSMKLDVDIDYSSGEGRAKNKNLVGWPRVKIVLDQALDVNAIDGFSMWMRVESNRDGDGEQQTPLLMRFNVGGANGDLPLPIKAREKEWFPVEISAAEILASTPSRKSTHIDHLQLWLCESDYDDQTKLTLYVDEIAFRGFKKPNLRTVEIARDLLLPAGGIVFEPRVRGIKPSVKHGEYTIRAQLLTKERKSLASASMDATLLRRSALPIERIDPGSYVFRCTVTDRDGATCSEWEAPLNAHAGPLYE